MTRWLPSSTYGRCLIAVLALSASMSGWLLVAGRGIPYVFDNNESFSTLWHAFSLYQFGVIDTFGLADEVFSPQQAAHPYVHTHQGDLPRLFAFVLYALGARTIQAQIAVTAATIGTLSAVLLYHTLARVARSPWFGLVGSGVFLTDYLLFAQWQVATYRVWHGLLLFGALTCVLGLKQARRRRLWLAATFVTFLALGYYELVFAAFVTIFAGLFALTRYWRQPRVLLASYAAQALGGLCALALLLFQLVGYLGWDGLREDLYLTYVARNLADAPAASAFSPSSMDDYLAFIGRLSATDPAFQASLTRFYEEHHVIFWWNLVDSRPLRSVEYVVGSLFVWVFQLYTPLVTLLVALPLSGAMLGGLASLVERRVGPPPAGCEAATRTTAAVAAPRDIRRAGCARAGPSLAGAAVSMAGLAAWGAALLILLVTIFRDQAYLGVPISRASFMGQVGLGGAFGLVAVALAGTALMGRVGAGTWRLPGTLSPWRIWLAAALLGLISVVVRGQSALYDQAYAPIWLDQIALALPPPLSRLALLAAAWLAALLIVVGVSGLLGAAAPVVARVAALLACGVLAYLIVDMLAAGYVLSGYLVRFSPMPVFVVNIGIALAVWIVLGAAIEGVRALRGTAGARSDRPGVILKDGSVDSLATPAATPTNWGTRWLTSATSAVAAILLGAVLAGYWIHAQRTYMAIFPPDQFTPVLDLLAQAPYRGSTAVVSMYSAPVAWQTQQWAYFDPVIGQAQPVVVDGRPTLKRDLDTYVWLADKRSNPAYLSPQYYVCMIPRSFRAALGRVSDRPDDVPRCGGVPLVAHAEAGDLTGLRARIVARDASGYDAWAIVELDW